MLAIPKVKPLITLEDDKDHKVLLIAEKNEELEKYIKEKEYSVDDNRTVELKYENFTMSKDIVSS